MSKNLLGVFIVLSLSFSAAAQAPQPLSGMDNFRYISGGALTTWGFGFGLGHFVVGEPEKGGFFLASQSVLLGGSFALWLSCPHRGSHVLIDPECSGQQALFMNLAIGTFMGLWFWQIYDVWWNGRDYLRNNYVEDNLSFQFNPIDQQFALIYRF